MDDSVKQKVYNSLHCPNNPAGKKFLLASSLLWAILLFAPGDTFYQDAYYFMSILAKEETWGTLFLLYSVYLYFSISEKTTKTIEVLGSTYGFFLWTATAMCVLFAPNAAPAIAAPHLVGTGITWWLLVKTGIKNG